MAETDLLTECKLGLGIAAESADFEGVINQKINTVKSFMQGAGVSAAKLDDPLATGIIVMGVCDLWNSEGGAVKFSPAFNVLLTQLVIRPEM